MTESSRARVLRARARKSSASVKWSNDGDEEEVNPREQTISFIHYLSAKRR